MAPRATSFWSGFGGAKVEYTGVVAGMSGSPVYLDGKLAGALAFRIGEFSKEPIAGVTPIAEMLEINAMDHSPNQADSGQGRVTLARQDCQSGSAVCHGGEPVADFANDLKPIETPLVFNGFSEDAIQLLRSTVCRRRNRARDGRRAR